METTTQFKNSPLHDKKAIIEMMDDLTPEQMVKVVNYLHQIKNNIFIVNEDDKIIDASIKKE